MSKAIVSIPFHETQIIALEEDGTHWVSPRHVCASIGIDWKNQHSKLNAKSWACVVLKTTHDSSGRSQELTMVDRKTFTMWLATIETSRVKDLDARRMIEQFQNEAADALDAYFNDGGAVNPRATPAQAQSVADRALAIAKDQLSLISLATSIADLDPTYVANMTRIALGRGMGEVPELPSQDMPLYAEDYLKERGVKGEKLKSLRSTFGRALATEYERLHGEKPKKGIGEVGSRARPINAYTAADRPLFDQVYAQAIAPKLEIA